MALEALVLRLAADTARLEKDLGRAQRVAEKKSQKMKASFAAAGKALAKIGAAATVAGGVLGGFAVKGITAADSMAKAAKAAGLSAETLQELRFAAERSGASTQQLDEGMRRFTKRIGEAAAGTGAAVKTLERLGITVTDVDGNMRSTEDVFDEFVSKVGSLGSQAEIAAAASALFGTTAGPKLALLLREGEEGISNLREEARALGIITNDQAAASEMAADAMTRMSQAAGNLGNQFAVSLAPAVTAVANFFARNLPAGFKIFEAGVIRVRKLWMDWLSFLFDGIAQVLDTFAALEQGVNRQLVAMGRDFNKIKTPIADAAREVAQFSKDLGELGDAYEEDYQAKIDEANASTEAFDRMLEEQQRTADDSADAMENLGGAVEEAADEVERFEGRIRIVDGELKILDRTGKELTGVVGTGGLATAFKLINEVTARLANGTLPGLVTIVDNTASVAIPGMTGALGAASSMIEEVTKQAAENEAATARMAENFAAASESTLLWADALGVLFNGLEGDAAAAVGSIQSVLGAWDQIQRIVAQQGGLSLSQQLGFGASVGGAFSFLGAGALGPGQSRQLASQGGGALGSVLGTMIGGPIGGLIGSVIGGIGGSLFGGDFGEENTRIQIGTGRAQNAGQAGADPRFFRRTALGLGIQGMQITEATGNAAAIMDALVDVDQQLANLARGTGLASIESIANALNPNSNRTTDTEAFVNVDPSVIIADRLNTALGGFDQRVQNLVGTITDAERGFQRLQAAVSLVEFIDQDIQAVIQQAVEDAGRTAGEIVADLGADVIDQVVNFDGTTEGLVSLANAAQTFQNAAITALIQIEQTRNSIAALTENTRTSLQFAALGDDAQAQDAFIRAQIGSSMSRLGTAGSAAEVQAIMQEINGLVTSLSQIGGGANLTREGGLQNLLDILDAAEGAAGQRLDDLETEIEDTLSSVMSELSSKLDTAGENLTGAAQDINAAAAGQAAATNQFGGAVAEFGGYVVNFGFVGGSVDGGA